MITKDELWSWYNELEPLEQKAIAQYLLFGNAELVFAFEDSSDTLKDFGRAIRRDELKQPLP